MKLLTSILSLFSMAYVAMTTSESFFLQSVRTGTAIQHSSIAVDGNNLVINGQQAVGGRISDDGLFWIGFQYVGLGPNSEVVLVDDKANALGGWSIKGGYVSNNQGTYAVPNGDGFYKLFFGTTQDQNNIPFAIMGLSTANDGSYVADFSPSQEPSTPVDTSSSVATTATWDRPSSSSVATTATWDRPSSSSVATTATWDRPSTTSSSAPVPTPNQGDSPLFYLQIIRSGSPLQFASIGSDGTNLVVNGKSGNKGLITAAGLLKIGDQFLAIGPNSEMSLTSDASKAATGFSIKNGYISGASFFAVKSDSGYNLFFGTTQDSNNIPFAIRALSVGPNPQPLPDFTPGEIQSTTMTTTTATESSTVTSIVIFDNGASSQTVGLSAFLMVLGAFLA